jgi:carbon-monoxide dehydrogenase large subunit
VIERLIDDAARALHFDPVELRQINLIPRDKIPYKNAFGLNYDSGDFPANQQRVLELADWAGFPRRRAEARQRGKLRGIGLANPIEKAAGPGNEFAEIRFHPSGNATLLMGSKNQGQGHETVFKQILNERLGLDPGEVQYIDGDTDRVAFGIGTNGSRSTVIGGSALWMAADKVIAKGRRVVDDVGTVVNPIGLKGQIHGGVMQGLGQAVMEQVAYDPESGQLLTGTFMDYAMPRAEDLAAIKVESNPCPTKLNPLGAKGAGEAGTVGALPAIVNAVMDALTPLGVKHIDMPTTSARIWQAMQGARGVG